MSEWIKVTEFNAIPKLGSRVVEVGDKAIAVFRTAKDEIFALRDSCPHKQGPLSQGIVHGTSVTCPLHNWKIDLQSGEALGPDSGCTGVYETRVKEEIVYLKLAD